MHSFTNNILPPIIITGKKRGNIRVSEVAVCLGNVLLTAEAMNLTIFLYGSTYPDAIWRT